MEPPAPTVRTLVRRGGIATALAVVVNLAIVLAADAAGIAPDLDPLGPVPVALFTVAGVVGATAVYALLTRTVERPDRTFLVVATVVLVLSLVPDATYAPTLPGATTAGVVVLALLHVTAAAVAVPVLLDRTRFR